MKSTYQKVSSLIFPNDPLSFNQVVSLFEFSIGNLLFHLSLESFSQVIKLYLLDLIAFLIRLAYLPSESTLLSSFVITISYECLESLLLKDDLKYISVF